MSQHVHDCHIAPDPEFLEKQETLLRTMITTIRGRGERSIRVSHPVQNPNWRAMIYAIAQIITDTSLGIERIGISSVQQGDNHYGIILISLTAASESSEAS
jgi:hypothetical protein